MSNIVTATFRDRAAFSEALRKLEGIGIHSEQISVMEAEHKRGNHFKIEEDSKADEGAIAGAAIGGIAGTLLSTMAVASSVLVPGLNLVIVGPLATALAGLGAGAFAGGVVGGLVGAGIPEHEAKLYEDDIKDGGVLVAVETSDSSEKNAVKEALRTAAAYNIAA